MAPTFRLLLFTYLAAAPLARANPYPPLVALGSRGNASLERRDCSNPCGWQDQYCCEADRTCVTAAGDIAVCTQGAGSGSGGSYVFYTTTYVEEGPITVTSTGSYAVTVVQTPAAGGSPVSCPSGNTCGALCCGSNEYCVTPGSCGPLGGSTQSAALRPTSNSVATVTSTGAATTIVPLSTSMPTSEAQGAPVNQGLSSGAIAGIVIGVLLGLFFLFLILACLCCKGIIDGILTLLGCRRKRRVEETTVIESRHSHHSGSRPQQRTWFGFGRPGRTEVVEEKTKKSDGMGGMLGVGAFLGTLAILLGLKRRHDRKKEEEKDDSYASVSYYSYEDYSTSESKYPRTRCPLKTADNTARFRKFRSKNPEC